ncbi:cytochrome-c peroxidase, partial [Porticoccaceae bacterium]|nr:cytochrome-c peroxidase [Porticoccaceae bacterium]
MFLYYPSPSTSPIQNSLKLYPLTYGNIAINIVDALPAILGNRNNKDSGFEMGKALLYKRQYSAKFSVFGLICAALFIASSAFAKEGDIQIQLADTCPPSFSLGTDNRCSLRHMYQLYDSLQDSGIGGLKTALPKARDGFSPQQIDLGRLLFFDPILSADNSVSCATCHNPKQGFSDA